MHKKRTINELRQTKDAVYEHPYTTPMLDIKELFELPSLYKGDEALGRAFRRMINSTKKNKSNGLGKV